jgi:phosphate transport system protein
LDDKPGNPNQAKPGEKAKSQPGQKPAATTLKAGQPAESPRPAGTPKDPTTRMDRLLDPIRQRLVAEGRAAVAMVEASLAATTGTINSAAIEEVLLRDEEIDAEEVRIEEACLRVLTLQQPVASDLRRLIFTLKVNIHFERMGDHACSIAKVFRKIRDRHELPRPTSLIELAERVPIQCHSLLRAIIDEDEDAAKHVIAGDRTIDALCKQLFGDAIVVIRANPGKEELGLYLHRLARELERIGDLLTNIAEDLVFLKSGQIVRHRKARIRAELGME